MGTFRAVQGWIIDWSMLGLRRKSWCFLFKKRRIKVIRVEGEKGLERYIKDQWSDFAVALRRDSKREGPGGVRCSVKVIPRANCVVTHPCALKMVGLTQRKRWKEWSVFHNLNTTTAAPRAATAYFVLQQNSKRSNSRNFYQPKRRRMRSAFNDTIWAVPTVCALVPPGHFSRFHWGDWWSSLLEWNSL